MNRRNLLLVPVILLAFALTGIIRHRAANGGDLVSSYGACRLLADHQADHLFSRDARIYDNVHDPVWDRLGRQTHFPEHYPIHPYVQTPIWAAALLPICTRVDFPAFSNGFLIAACLVLPATIGLIAWAWTPQLLHPGWIALLCLIFYQWEAYKSALSLVQTHIFFTLLALLAILCDRRDKPFWAGALLALAAAVKITPGFLLFYWLGRRRPRAVLSFLACSLALAGLGLLALGWPLYRAYLQNLADISNILLVSWNNQSLAGWWMSSHYPPAEQMAWHSLPLPPAVKWTCTLLSLLACYLGGVLDREPAPARPAPPATAQPLPYGAAFALVGLTVFTPIAWDHYYIVLIFPLMLLLAAGKERKSLLLFAVAFLICALNYDPGSFSILLRHYEPFPIVRAQFYSGLLAMAALAFAAATSRPPSSTPSSRRFPWLVLLKSRMNAPTAGELSS